MTIRQVARASEKAGGTAAGIAALMGTQLTLAGTTLRESAGVGVAVSASSAFITDTVVSTNPIGISVQDGSSLLEQSEPSTDPFAVVIAPSTRFVANQTRVEGAVPMPTPIR